MSPPPFAAGTRPASPHLVGGPLMLVLLVGILCLSSCWRIPAEEEEEPPPPHPSVQGTLRIAAYGSGTAPSGREPLAHEQCWVRGVGYAAMEDDDLRGFLDGRFIYGWNQPGQIHTRLGRRPTRARFGETELFRTLQRWDGLGLPRTARIERARLRLAVEKGPRRPLVVLVYAVRPDWDPGRGGTRHDNTSPPAPGEVWWGEARHGVRRWGLPGVGFASEDHPQADTPVTALAEAFWEPGQAGLVFESEALRAYVQTQARAGEPLRLLLKLSDELEDQPGSLLYLYSTNFGDLRNPARRPVLELRWHAPDERMRFERRLHLEHGRMLETPRLALEGSGSVVASFVASQPDGAMPTLELRGGRGDEVSPWLPAAAPREVAWSWVQVRVFAGAQPVELGETFETDLRDTWVRSAPPEEQEVRFELVAPRGASFLAAADYQGDYRWQLRFEPDEVGHWRYRFRERFLDHPLESPWGHFDVVLTDRDNARRQLRRFVERLRREQSTPDDDRNLSPLAPTFWRLERAALRLETPESFVSPSGRALFGLLTEARELLSKRRVPDEPRLTPMEREF